MKCLTPTVSFNLFTDNYLISFRLFVCLPTLELATFKQEAYKNKLRKYTIIGVKQVQKMERGHFEQCSAHQAKTLSNLCGWLER